MEWFAVRVLRLANEFRCDPSVFNNGDQLPMPPVSSATLQALTGIGQDFDELANTCLLVLHLEVLQQHTLDYLLLFFLIY